MGSKSEDIHEYIPVGGSIPQHIICLSTHFLLAVIQGEKQVKGGLVVGYLVPWHVFQSIPVLQDVVVLTWTWLLLQISTDTYVEKIVSDHAWPSLYHLTVVGHEVMLSHLHFSACVIGHERFRSHCINRADILDELFSFLKTKTHRLCSFQVHLNCKLFKDLSECELDSVIHFCLVRCE